MHVCMSGDDPHRAATEALKKLDAVVRKLRPSDTVRPAARALEDLLASPCLQMARFEAPGGLAFDSALSLRTWWDDGGHAWIEDMLEMPSDWHLRQDRGRGWTLRVPPDVPRTLTLETRPSGPLAPLLCSAADATCGAETAGWVMRANRVLRERRGLAFDAEDPKTEQDCTARALARPPRERYATAHTCFDRLVPRGARVPLGRFRAPKTGWIVLRGRRGHYEFCDEVRAYDLATGAAWVAQGCSGLKFGGDGFVDEKAVERAKGVATRVGRVPVDDLREVALFMLLSAEIQDRVVLDTRWFTLPAGVVPRRARDARSTPRERPEGWRSSAQTRLAWTWMEESTVRHSGTFLWPGASEAADDYVAELVQALEASFVEGCAPARLPAALLRGGAKPAVSPIDASEGALDATDAKLTAALSARGASSLCKPD
jgi:hypothetical protein